MPDPPLRGRLATVDGGQSNPRNEVLHALANPRRRIVLATLAGGAAPVTEQTLARRVVARERAAHPDQRAPRSGGVSLAHVHLPMLAAAGLVDYTPDGVVPTERLDALLHTCPVQSLLDGTLPMSPESVDHGLDLLAHDVRRQAIEELAAHRRLSIDELAEALVTSRGRPLDVPEHVDRIALELHHVHVPKLVDAGVVDRDGHDLRYLGDPFLDEWWFTQ